MGTIVIEISGQGYVGAIVNSNNLCPVDLSQNELEFLLGGNAPIVTVGQNGAMSLSGNLSDLSSSDLNVLKTLVKNSEPNP